jgi:hypothetical protein
MDASHLLTGGTDRSVPPIPTYTNLPSFVEYLSCTFAGLASLRSADESNDAAGNRFQSMQQVSPRFAG